MDRDIALQITEKITAINTALQSLVTNTTPTADSRSVPADAQRSAPDPDETREQDPEPDPVPNKK